MASPIYKTTTPLSSHKNGSWASLQLNSKLNWGDFRRRQRQIELFSQFGGKDAAAMDVLWVG